MILFCREQDQRPRRTVDRWNAGGEHVADVDEPEQYVVLHVPHCILCSCGTPLPLPSVAPPFVRVIVFLARACGVLILIFAYFLERLISCAPTLEALYMPC